MEKYKIIIGKYPNFEKQLESLERFQWLFFVFLFAFHIIQKNLFFCISSFSELLRCRSSLLDFRSRQFFGGYRKNNQLFSKAEYALFKLILLLLNYFSQISFHQRIMTFFSIVSKPRVLAWHFFIFLKIPLDISLRVSISFLKVWFCSLI